MAMCIELYGEKVFSPKKLELLPIAFDASYGSAYSPYTRHHIKKAFKAGATTDEIMQVLKLVWYKGCRLAHSVCRFWLRNWSATPRASA
jgi:alkylhydroperoxidase/carboxymuconolactone decarboxylase family protein YurZ